MNSWEAVKQEIIERLHNLPYPTSEDIAEYIEKAYRLGYAKGVRTSMGILKDKMQVAIESVAEIMRGEK